MEEEIIAEGKNFRLVPKEELEEIMEYLEQYLPYSLKVSAIFFFINSKLYEML